MGRRSAGLAVVVVALLAVIVLAQINDKGRAAGSAVAESIAGAPRVGDCLLEQPPDGGGWGYQGAAYPTLRIAPCQGVRWGEVVSVVPGGLTASTSKTDADGSVENPVQSRCSQDGAMYLSGSGPLFLDWSWEMGSFAAIGPTARQRAAGQSWVACVITPNTGSGSARYRGSLEQIVAQGRLPTVFATCAATVQDVVSELTSQGPVPNLPCDHNHGVEILGLDSQLAGVTQRELDSSCGELTRWLTRIPGAGVGGLVLARAIATHLDLGTSLFVPGFGSNGIAMCIVEPAGDRQLNASLVGLGAGPIPWS